MSESVKANSAAAFAAVIPAFAPDSTLVGLVRELAAVFPRIIVVDDGSAAGREVFDRLEESPATTVLRHAVNRGKGAALKTAMKYVLERAPEISGIVTVDADGQHLCADAERVASAAVENPDRLILGVRDFGRGVPFRSRFGNLWTRAEFRLLTGAAVGDTQSGLRALPRSLLSVALAIAGERYEYEIRELVHFARAGRVKEIPISTVYAPGNPTSHYRVLRDTWLTQSALFAAAFTRRNFFCNHSGCRSYKEV